MTAGPNCKLAVWRWTFDEDNRSGGAEPTGTYVYNDILARIQEQATEQVIYQQGLEVPKIYHATLQPPWYTIYERDEVEVVTPTDSPWYGQRFRVLDVQQSSHTYRDPRRYLMLTLRRSERAHGSQ